MKYREKRESDKSKDTIVNVNVEHYEFERIKKVSHVIYLIMLSQILNIYVACQLVL